MKVSSTTPKNKGFGTQVFHSFTLVEFNNLEK
jgi:hypothetical protein